MTTSERYRPVKGLIAALHSSRHLSDGHWAEGLTELDMRLNGQIWELEKRIIILEKERDGDNA